MAEQQSSLGDLLKRFAKAKDKKDKYSAAATVADKEYRAIEDELLLRMREEGTTIARGAGLTVSIAETDVPQIEDWDELTRFVLRNKRLDLFQRRLSTTAYRELLEQKKLKALPGCKNFTKWSVRVTTGK